MPHYILHIGPHKTGTSFLQRRLQDNVVALERAGIHLASLWNDSDFNPSHVGLVQRLSSERIGELKPVFEAFRTSAFKAVVISCEELATVSREPVKVQMLRELTFGSPVSIVYYVRRWPDLLASEWQEYIKQGSTLPLPEVLVHNLRDPTASRIINIDLCLATYAQIFGKPSLRVVSYDSVLSQWPDLFAHFTRKVLNAALPIAANNRVVNASLPPANAELMRLFNCLEQQTGVPSRALLRYVQLDHPPVQIIRLLDHLTRFYTTIDVNDDDAGAGCILLANRTAYDSCALPPVDQERFYEAETSKLAFIRPEYGLTPGFADAVRLAWNDLLAVERSRLVPEA